MALKASKPTGATKEILCEILLVYLSGKSKSVEEVLGEERETWCDCSTFNVFSFPFTLLTH